MDTEIKIVRWTVLPIEPLSFNGARVAERQKELEEVFAVDSEEDPE